MTRHHHPGPAGRRSLRRRDQRGAALVEFSLVIVPLMLILYGLIAFGLAFGVKNSLTSAVSEGARSSIGAPDGTEAAVAKATVAERLSWLGTRYQDSDTTATVVDCATGLADAAGECIRVVINFPYESRALIPSAPGLGLLLPENIATEATVKFS